VGDHTIFCYDPIISPRLLFSSAFHHPVLLSVVLPCLNEVETVGMCIDSINHTLDLLAIHYEVIVADNGSTDESAMIAAAQGARVISVPERGYGRALLGGLRAATGDVLLMMDCDNSYSATDIPVFLHALQKDADFVLGCRFKNGGGTILPDAMPRLHQHIGNPLFSWMLRRFFRLPFHDVHCGMRAMRRSLLESLTLAQPDMTFAFELLLRSRDSGARLAEVPITLHPDGRHAHGSHLHTFRDGLRMVFLLWYKHS
jgi:glycosyltransferase involved in cell wall biosynthesis